MARVRFLALLGLAAAALAPSLAQAGDWHPRSVVGGHPYHNGNYFVPPSSAYEAPRVFPPPRYGFPAYYLPNSYLPAGMAQPTVWNPQWPNYGYPVGAPHYGFGSFGYGYYRPAYGF